MSSAIVVSTVILLYFANGEEVLTEFKPQEEIKGIFEDLGFSKFCIASVLAKCENTTQTNTNKPQEEIKSIFEAFGYSKVCIANILAKCENSAQTNTSMDSSKDWQSEIISHSHRPLNCADLLAMGDVTSGVRIVYPFIFCPDRPISVFCDQTTDGGNWTVIQRRAVLPQREDFYRTWAEYVRGFGNLTGEFWLGLDNIHSLLNATPMELRIDLEDFNGEKRFAKYGLFHVGDSDSKYVLKIGRYSGNAGDSLTKVHDNQKFSTLDQDNGVSQENCAEKYRGAWWYGACHTSNLNGFQYEGNHASYADGINWNTWRGIHYSHMKTTMSIRPRFE